MAFWINWSGLAMFFLALIFTSAVLGFALWSMRVGVYWFTSLYVLAMYGLISSPVPCERSQREMQCLAEIELHQSAPFFGK